MFELTIFLSEGGTAVPIIVGQPERCAQECVQLGMHYRKDDGVLRWGDIAAEYRLWWGWYITCHLVPCRVPISFPHMKQNVSDLMLKKSEQKLARYFQSLWRNSFNSSEKLSKIFLVSSQLLENILQDWFSFSKYFLTKSFL